jgi:filamentous hemagglutinin family protein
LPANRVGAEKRMSSSEGRERANDMTDFSKIKSLPGGGWVMLRGSRKKTTRFAPKSLSLALASAFSGAGISISQAITGLSITLAGLSSAQAQSSNLPTNLPSGGVAVHGGATFQQSGTTLNVNTTNGAGTNNSIINWQSFSIGAGHTTNINQPNAQSSSLNRVITNTPSQIYGTLRSNGQVILVNQNGIAVGAGGVVDTAGFTASTLNISDADAKAGKLRFQGNSLSGGVQVDGVIRSSNGDILLFAPNVAIGKDGLVKAENGNVIVGAGQSVEVTGRGLEGVKFIIQGADNKAINLGTLQGNAVGVFAGTLRHSGVIQAQSATMEGGKVVLRAIKDVEIVRDPSLANAPKIIADGGVNAQGVAQSGGNIQIQSTQGNVTIGAGSSISANAGNSSQNSSFAGMNAAGGAINIEALQGKVLSEAGSHISATGSPGGIIRIYGNQEARIASIVNASSPSLGASDAAGTLQLITSNNIGGTIQILSPGTVALTTGAQLTASGDAGGGTILVGGDYQGANAAITNAQDTNISQGVLLEANARVNGNGGKVIVWADNDTNFSGTLHAKGGEQGGDGGFGETSGKKNLYFRGRADLSARRGRMGTLLLDPDAIVIQGGSGISDPNFTGGTITAGAGGTLATIYEADLEAISGNILLEAANKISFVGLAFGGGGLFLNGDLTLRTTNATSIATGMGVSFVGMNLAATPQFTIQAGGNILIEAGTKWTSGVTSGAADITSTNISGSEKISLISTGGSITMKAAGGIGLGNGLVINAAKTVNISSGNYGITNPNSSDILVNQTNGSSGVQITGESVSIVAGNGGKLQVNQNSKITANAAAAADILLQAAGQVFVQSGASLQAANGKVTLDSKLSDVVLANPASPGAHISAQSIVLQSQASDGLIDIYGFSSLTSTNTTGDGITLRADRLRMESTPTVSVANGSRIVVRPNDNTRDIKLSGGNDNLGSGSLQISQTELDNLTDGNFRVQFGDNVSYTGNIILGADATTDFSTAWGILLTNGGSITQGSDVYINNQARMEAGSINLVNAGNQFNTIAMRSTSGSTKLATSSSVVTNTLVDGLFGIESAGSFSLNTSAGGLSTFYAFAGIATEGNIGISGFGSVDLGINPANPVLDSNKDNAGNSGSINLGSSVIRGNASSSLTLDSSTSSGTAGNISFGNVQISTTSTYLGSLTVNSSGTTAGQITLPSSITVGSGGVAITGKVILTQAVDVTTQGSGAITFNGEIQGGFGLALTSDTGDITLNATAGNSTFVGTVDIFSNEGTVNLNKNITTTAGGNVNVVAANVNVANNAEIYAGGLVYLEASGTAATNTLSAGTGSVLLAGTGMLSLLAENNITLNGQVSGYADLNINSSAGAVIMSSAVNVTGYQTIGSPGTKSISIHGQTGVTLAHTSGSNIYNATVTTGAGQTIASSGSPTQLAGFNATTLGSAAARSNIGSSGSRINIGGVGAISAYADTSLYLNSSNIAQDVQIAHASLDATSSNAAMDIISQRNIQIQGGTGISVLGANKADIKLQAANTFEALTGISGNGSNSSVSILANDKMIFGGGANITQLGSLSLSGKSAAQAIRFVDSDTVAVNAGSLNIAYGSLNQIDSTVGHVVVGVSAQSPGNITFEGSSAFAPSGAKKYSFFTSGNISSTAARNMDLSQAGFSATGSIGLSNVSLFNSAASAGVIVAASGSSVDLKVVDAEGVTLATVGSSLPAPSQLNGINSSGGNINFVNTAGGITSGAAATYDFYTGSGSVTIKAHGNIGSTGSRVSAHGSSFSLGNAGVTPTQTTIAVDLTQNSSSTLKTSNITVDKTAPNLGILFIGAKSTTDIDIDSNTLISSNNLATTLSNIAGNIKVSQANALFSGTGTMTLDAATTTFEKLTTIAAGHTVKASTGNSTVASGLGGLSGAGTFSNTGTVLLVNGTIAPGAGGIGTLTISGGVTMGSTGIFDAELGTTATNGDRLVVGQNFVAGGTLNVIETNLSSTVAGTNYTVATVGGTASGTFANTNSSAASFSSASGAGVVTVNASSLTNKWINTSNGTWSVGSNWSRGIAPTATHDAWIDVASVNPTVTVTAGAVANSLHVGDTLTLNSSLGITGGMTVLNGGTWNHASGGGSTITAGSNITIDAGGVMNWSGGVIGASTDTSSKLFVNNGTINISGPGSSYQDIYRNWNNNGVVNWTGGRFTELVANASGEITFTNTATGQINLNTTFTGTDSFISGGLGSLINQGTITSASSNAATTTRLNGTQNALQNTGKIFANVGTLSVGTSGSLAADTGGYTIASGAALEFAASRFLNAGASLEGIGQLRVASGAPVTVTLGVGLGVLTAGSVNLAGQLNLNTGNAQTINTLGMSTGGAVFSGDAVNIGSLTAAGGTFSGTGIFTTNGASSITGELVRSGGQWNNTGAMSLTSGGRLYLTSSSTLTNSGSGSMSYTGTDSTAIYSGSGTNRFINQGNFVNDTGTATRGIFVNFDNSGSVQVTNGKLELNNGGSESGTYTVASGAGLTIKGGSARNFTAGGLLGSGTLELTNSSNTTLSNGVNTSLLQNGTVSLNGANLTLNTGSGFTFASAVTLAGGATLSYANAMSGALNVTGGSGLTAPTSTVWTLPTLTTSTLSMGLGSNFTTNSNAILQNQGVLNFSGAGTLSLGGNLSNQGIANLTGNGFIIGSGTFNNTSLGTVNRSGSAGNFSVLSNFTQSGTLNANSGTLTFGSAVINSGLITGISTLATGATSLTNSSTGTIAPGGIGAVGNLTLNGTLFANSGSKILIDAASTASYDKFNVTGNITSTAGATISVAEATPFLAVNDQLNVLTFGGNFSGVLPTIVSPVGVTLASSTTSASNGALRLTASAISNFWLDANVDLNYANNANWSRGHTPTITEDAIINPSAVGVNVTLASGTQTPRSLQLTGDDFLTVNGGTLTLAQTSTVASSAGLALSSGQINGAGDLNIAGGFTWSNGSIEGTGKLRTASGVTSTLAGSGSRFLRREWENQGTINLSTGYLQVYDSNGTLTNQSSGVMNVTSTYTPDPLAAFNAGAQINNEGTINWNTGNANTLNGPFNNKSSGIVNVQGASQLSLAGDGADAGNYSIGNAAAGLIFSGTRSLSAGSNITGSGTFTTNSGATTLSGGLGIASTGTVQVTGGTLTLNTSSPTLSFANALSVSGGTLTGSNSFNANGGLNWSGGSIEGTGTLFTASGVTSSLGGGVGRFLRRSWNNEGTINLGGSAYLQVYDSLGTLTNKSGGILNVTSSYAPDPLAAFNAGAQINNEGTINWNTGNSNTLSGPFSNKSGGIVNVQGTSQLSLAGDGTDAGIYSISTAAGLILASGTRSLTAGSNITGTGTLTNSGATSVLSGALGIVSLGSVRVTGGTLTLNTTSPTLNFANALTVSGGTLNGSNDFNANAGLNWTGGSIEGTGVLRTPSTVTSSLGGVAANRLLRRSWDNAGTINLAGSGYLHVDGSSATLSNLSGGTLNVSSSYAIDPLASTNGALINNKGELVWNTGLSQNFNGTLNNQSGGKISIAGASSLDLSATAFAQITGATIDIGSGSTLKRQVVGLTNNGLITGAGTIDVTGATLTNAAGGTIAPGGAGTVATLSIAGSANLAAGTLLFDLDTAALYDRIAVAGNLTLGSAPLVLSELSGNYTAGDNFNLITYGGTVSGSAPTLNTTAITDVTFAASTSAASSGSVIASTSSVINRWLDGVTGSWQKSSNWSRGHVPTLTEDVVIAPTGTHTVLLSVGTGKARSLTISGDDTLSLADTTTLQLGSGSSTIGAGTTLTMDNSHIQGGVGSSITNQGTISGTGTITVGSGTGTLTNANGGMLLPGDVNGFVDIGTLTINGNLQLNSNSKIYFDLNKTGSDKIAVTGDINLVGATNAPNILFTEFNGPSFTGLEAAQTVMTAGGSFNGIASQLGTPTNGSSDINFSAFADFAGKALTAQVVSINNYWSNPTPAGGDWFTNSNWSRGLAPNQVHNVFIDQPTANLVTITAGAATARTLMLGDGANANTLAISGSGASLTVNNPSSISSMILDVEASSTLILSGGAKLLLGAGQVHVDSGAVMQLNAGTVSVFGGSQGNTTLNNEGLIISNGASVLGQPTGGKEIILENLNSTGIGTIEVASGELQIQSDSFNQFGLIKINTNISTLNYVGGSLFNDGTISGSGVIKIDNGNGVLENYGTISPGTGAAVGILQVIGDFNNNPGGTLHINAASASSNSQLNVSGAVNLDGTLSLGTIPTHAFAGGQMYDIVTGASSVTGSFSQIVGQGPYVVNVSGSNPVSMAFSLGAGSIEWIGTDGDWSVASNWKDSNNINRVPISTDFVIINPAGARTVTLNTAAASALSGLTMADLGAGMDTLFIASGGVLTLPTSNNTLNGLLVVGGGSLTVPADVSMASLNHQSGSLTVNTGSTLTLTAQGTFQANVAGSGTIANASGATSQLMGVNIAPSLVNNGTLIISNTVTASSLSLASGSLYLNNGTLVHSAGDLINSPGAAIIGSGTIDVGAGKLINQSSIQPGGFTGLGTISILGGADLSAGLIDFELFSTSSYDKFTATGAVVLGGSVRLIENGPFIGSGDSFSGLITAGSLSGTMPSFTLFDTSLNTITEVSMNVSKAASNFSANVASVTNNWASSTGGQWNVASNWSRGHAPRLGEDVVIDPVGNQVVTLSGASGSAQNISMPGSNGADSLRIDGADLVINNSLTTAGYLLLEGTSKAAAISAGADITVASLNVNGNATVQAGQTIYSSGGVFTGASANVTIDAQQWKNTGGTLSLNLISSTIDLGTTNFVNESGSTLSLNGAGTSFFLSGGGDFINDGLITGIGTINVGAGLFTNSSTGTLSPGLSGGGGIGTLTFAGNTDLSNGAAELELANASSYDRLHMVNAVTTSSGFNLRINGAGTGIVGGDAFSLFSYGGLASGSLPTVTNNVGSGKTFALSQPSAFGSSFVLTANGVFVTNIFWDGGGDGISWSDKFNWSTDLLPVAGQNVTLNSSSNTVTIAAGTNISGLIGFNLDATDALFITGGSLALPGSNLNLNGTVNLAGGTITGNAAGGSFAGGLNWTAGKFGGTGTYSSSNLTLGSIGGGIRTLDGATLVAGSPSGTLLSVGQLVLNSGQYNTGSFGFAVGPAATLAFAGGDIFSAGVTNNGLVRVDSGSVALNNTAIQTGAFSIASGANLSFQNNVSLGSSASILGGSWTVDNGKTVITSAALNRGAGGTTFINGTLQLGGDFETEQLIFLSGGSISGGSNALRVTQQWNDSAIGAGSVTGLGSATITQATGNLQFNKSLAVTDNVLLSASAGSITGGTNAITAGQRLQANASGLVDLDVQAATLAASSSGGNIVLDVTGPTVIDGLSTAAGRTATINTTGNVGQIGIINTAGHIDLNLAGNGVSWLNSGNVFGQGVRVNSGNLVQLISNAANPMSISGSMATLEAGGGAVQMGDSYGTLSVSGPLTVVASGNISQGAALNITGLADLNGSSITLGTASTYGGGVKFVATGPVLLNATGALDVRGSTPGSLSLTATGNITQSGTLNIGGAASLTATGKNITLNNPANNFLSVYAVADQINLTDADTNNNGLAISGTLGTIASYLVGGNLTSNGLLTSPVLNVNNSASGRSVNLGSLNVNNLVSFNTSAGAYTDISYNNAGIAQLGAPIVATGNVSIATAGGLNLPSVSASSFTVSATGGDITQFSGSILRAPVASFSSAANKDIVLTEVGNELQSFTASGRNVSVVSTKTLDPNIASTGNVVINAVDINQTAGHAVVANSFTANVTGGLGLFGSGNQLGSVSGTAVADIQINDSGSSLLLNGLQAGAANGINISSTGSLIQGAGQLVANKVSLSGAAIGAAGAGQIQLDASSGVRFNATGGNAYVRNNNSNTHELAGASAAGTLHYETTTGNGYQVTGNVNATNVELLSGGAMQIGGTTTPVQVTGSNSVLLDALGITVGSATGAASSAVFSNGSLSINAPTSLSILGGNQSGAFASVDANGPVTVNVPMGGVTIAGGSGAGAYAKLDPASALSVTSSNAISLLGGAGAGAYAAIVANGNITLNAPSLSLTMGSGLDADAVVVSNFGRITAPGNCNGCVDLNIAPLGNGSSNVGLYEGARIIGQSNATNLLTTQLTQINTVLEEAQRDPERRRDPEPEISVEGQNCP